MMVKMSQITTVLVLLLSMTIMAHRPEPTATEIGGHTLHTLMEPGGIPAIFDPQFVDLAVADSFYYDKEPLMVVRSGDEVRGYSTWHLDRHEIVNDYIDGHAIAITW